MERTNSAGGHVPALDFQLVFNTLSGNFLLLQPNPPLFTILAVSDEQLQITGQKREVFVGRSIFEVYPDDPEAIATTDPTNLRDSLTQVMKDKVPGLLPVFRYDLVNADGIYEERYWQTSSKPVLDAEGNVRYILLRPNEITEQVKAERRTSAMGELEKKYSLFMQAPVAVYIVSGPENIVELANDEMLRLLGKASDMIGKPLLASIPEIAEAGFPELLDQVRTTGQPYYGKEYPAKLIKDGQQVLCYYNFVYQPYYANPGDTVAAGVFCVAHEVTEQVLARQKVEESELQLRSFIESSHHPIGVYFGREMRIQFANQALKDGLGKGNDIVGKLYKDVLPELENQHVFEQLEEVYTTGIPFHAKNHKLDLVVGGELRTFFFDLSMSPLFNTAGEVYGVINTGADVTELILAREKAAESEWRYRTLIEEAPIATALYLGKDLTIQYANDIMLGYWGKDNTVVGKTFRNALPELEGQPFPALLEKVYASGQTYTGVKEKAETEVDGRLVTAYFSYTYKPLFDTAGAVYGIHHTAIDVTEEVLAQKRLEESARDLQNLADAMPQIVWIANADGEVTYYNERVSGFLGAVKLSDGNWHWESMIIEEDEQLTVEAWEKAVRTGMSYEIEHRLRMQDGSYRWHLSRALPQRDSKGNITRWFGTATDVHERKEHQEALEVNNRHLTSINNDLDNFIYTASHDLKAPILNIEGLLTLLSDEHSSTADQENDTQEILNMMKGSVERFKKTIDSLTEVAKLQQENEYSNELVNVAEVIKEVTLDLAPLMNSTQAILTIDVAYDTAVRFSAKNLRSVVYNLLSNAIKYRSPHRTPHVQISCHLSDQYQVLTFADNGLGMTAGQRKSLFTLFKRFHDHVEGTGIGLYMVKKVVENADGKIEVESKANEGTTFRVYLPV